MKPKNKYPLLFAVLMALGISPSYAQVNESDGAVLKDEKQSVDNDKIFDFVEQMPEYPGGQRALLQWIGSNIKYPAIAEENGIQGRVVCSFIVERDGSITDVQVARSIDPSLDNEAVRVLSQMPHWNAGRHEGIPVRVKNTVPVTFKLVAGSLTSQQIHVLRDSYVLKTEPIESIKRIQFSKYYKGERNTKASFDLSYISNKALEQECSKFLFDDDLTNSLEESVNKYVKSLGKEKTTTDIDEVCSYKLYIQNNLQGKCISFVAEYQKHVIAKKTHRRIDIGNGKKSFLLDLPNGRILSLEDIVNPLYATAIKKAGFDGNLSLSPKALLWGNGQDNYEIDFITAEEQFTDAFKSLMGLDTLIVSYKDEVKRQNLIMAKTEEKNKKALAEIEAQERKMKTELNARQQEKDAGSQILATALDSAQVAPRFPGGQGALKRWITDNLKYPNSAKRAGVWADVVCTFVVSANGSISYVEVNGSTCLPANIKNPTFAKHDMEQAAYETLKKMPKWQPGRQKGKPVSVKRRIVLTEKEVCTVKSISPVQRVPAGFGKINYGEDVISDEEIQAGNEVVAANNVETLKTKGVVTDKKPKEENVKIFDIVEQMPEFPGGQPGLLRWITDNIKYPTIAEENGIQGVVVCTFVIERDGSTTDVQVARSIDPSLDKEAVRVLKKMPRWKAGKHKGQTVRVKYTVPVTFKLR